MTTGTSGLAGEPVQVSHCLAAGHAPDRVARGPGSAVRQVDPECLIQALGQCGDSILLTDDAGIIQYVNATFEQVTGFRAHEVIGRTPRFLRSGQHEPAFYEALWATIGAGRVFRAVFANRRSDGDVFYEDKTITPVRDGTGTITHFVSTGRDVTQAMLTRQQLRETRRELQSLRTASDDLQSTHRRDLLRLRTELEQARRTRAHLLDAVSHELLIPVKALLDIAEVGRNAVSAARAALCFEQIGHDGARLRRMIEELLALKTPSHGGIALTRRWCRPAEVVHAAVRELQPAAASRSVTLHVDADPDTAAWIDPLRIEQMLRHLLSNAIRFSPRHGRVLIELANSAPKNAQGYRLELAVADAGSGIPPHELESIFEPFRQGSRTRTRGGGMGIGLAVCRLIAQAHGGTLVAANRAEGGARLVASLPIEGANVSCA